MHRRLRWACAVVTGLLAAAAVWLLGPPPRARLEGERLTPAGFSPDSRWLIADAFTPGGDRLAYLVVDAAGGELRLQLPNRSVHSWAFAPDGRHLARAVAVNDAENAIEVWDLETASEVKSQRWHPMPPNLSSCLPRATLAYTAEGKLLLGSDSRGVWDVTAHARIRDLPDLVALGPMPARNWAFTDRVGYHEERRRVRLVSVQTGAVVSEFPLPASLRNYRWSPGGRFLAADFYEKTQIHVADARSGTSVALTDGDGCVIESLAEAVPHIAVSGDVVRRTGLWTWLPWLPWADRHEDTVRVIDFQAHRLLGEWAGSAAVLSPDGATLALRTRAGSLELWDVPRRTPWRGCLGAGLVGMALVLLASARRRKNRHKSPARLDFGESKSAPPASNLAQ